MSDNTRSMGKQRGLIPDNDDENSEIGIKFFNIENKTNKKNYTKLFIFKK
jgi:hypothetical protein